MRISEETFKAVMAKLEKKRPAFSAGIHSVQAGTYDGKTFRPLRRPPFSIRAIVHFARQREYAKRALRRFGVN